MGNENAEKLLPHLSQAFAKKPKQESSLRT
jgi:hypothetical protein